MLANGHWYVPQNVTTGKSIQTDANRWSMETERTLFQICHTGCLLVGDALGRVTYEPRVKVLHPEHFVLALSSEAETS